MTSRPEVGTSHRPSITAVAGKLGGSKWKNAARRMSLKHETVEEHVRLENTYRLTPEPSARFSVSRVQHVIEELLRERLAPVGEYDPKVCAALTQSLADELRHRVKLLGYSRYKLVCAVTLGQQMGQGVHVVSRALWDATTDCVATASASHSNGIVYGSACVAALYFD